MKNEFNLGLNRRAFLRGIGTLISLPLFESLVPSKIWAQETKLAEKGIESKMFPRRFLFNYMPNGADLFRWYPIGRKSGKDYELNKIMQPFAPFKDKMLILSGLAHDTGSARYKNADGTIDDQGAGDHARENCTALTGARPLKSNSITKIGASFDQLLAAKIGKNTRLPSLELCLDRQKPNGSCDSYVCSLQGNLSFINESQPAPAEINPRLVFEKLFGTGGSLNETTEAKAKRELYNKSVLDFALEDAKSINHNLSVTDKQKLDEYLTAIRDLENRIESSKNFSNIIPDSVKDFGKDLDAASNQLKNSNTNFEELAKTMFDLQTLALQGDQTRIITFSFGHGGLNNSYPWLSTPAHSDGTGGDAIVQGYHDCSHFGNDPKKKEIVMTIQTYLASLTAGFVQKLQDSKEGNGSILDNSALVFMSSLSDSNRHYHTDLPIVIFGSLGGVIKNGEHIDLNTNPEIFNDVNPDLSQIQNEARVIDQMVKGGMTPANNLFMSIAKGMGVKDFKSFGDATGELTEIFV